LRKLRKNRRKFQNYRVRILSSKKLKKSKEGLELISSGLLTLYKEFPEFTIPEYVEIVEVINKEVLAKLSPLITQQMTEEDLKQLGI